MTDDPDAEQTDSAVSSETAGDDSLVVSDEGLADTLAADALEIDSSAPDGAADTATVVDTLSAVDSLVVDTAMDDTFVADTFVADTFVVDTFVADTFVADTFVADTFVADTAAPPSCETPPAVAGALHYARLSDANLYAAGAAGSVRSCWLRFRPAYELWSDGLVKTRYVYLPPGSKITTGPNAVTGAAPNMDRWEFPIGTRFIKEFARADGKKLETRIWERTAAGYRMGSFRWRADQTDADYTESGGAATLPLDDGTTTHTIPRRADCVKCHDGEPGKGLGFSAVQLSKVADATSDVTLVKLIADGWLSHPPASLPAPNGSPVPGTAVEAAALGALHASCGHCHNPMGDAKAIDMDLRVRYGDTVVATSPIYLSLVGVATKKWNKYGISLRIDPGATGTGNGSPSTSAVYYRASVRGTPDEMPTLGSVVADKDGLLKSLDAWIKSL